MNSFPSWTWQYEAPINVGSAAVPRFSTAASSGFPSMATATASSTVAANHHHHLHCPNLMLRNHYNNTPSVISPNITHFCCRSWVCRKSTQCWSFYTSKRKTDSYLLESYIRVQFGSSIYIVWERLSSYEIFLACLRRKSEPHKAISLFSEELLYLANTLNLL